MKCINRVNLFIIILLISGLFSPVFAGDVLLKIAHVDESVVSRFSVTKRGLFSVSHSLSAQLLKQALNSGISVGTISGKYDKGNILRTSLVEKKVEDASQQLQRLFRFTGRLTGRQLSGGICGWDKCIISFDEQVDSGDCLLEIGGDNSLYHGKVSTVAVTNDMYELELWNIHDNDLPAESEKLVRKLDRSYFMQQVASAYDSTWLKSMIPQKNGIGLIILKEEPGSRIQGSSDSVLIWITKERLLDLKQGLPEVSVVIGWE